MLVLALKLRYPLEDKVVVRLPDGSRMLIQLVEHDRAKVRIGFDAPPGVLIDRACVFQEKCPGEPVESRPPRMVAPGSVNVA
jgi:sRNA-binding carbon storage regulator CsrA